MSGTHDTTVVGAALAGTLSPASYWERRAREYAAQGRGLAAVCSYGMPEFYNRYIDRLQRGALGALLHGRVGAGRTALDVGCGVGRWSMQLAQLGYDVTGMDISPYMIEQARRHEQQWRRLRSGSTSARCRFQVGNVVHAELDGRYDLILSVTVLQHILSEQEARHAIAKLASHLSPGGELILLEVAPSYSTARCDTAVFNARTLEWYRDALKRAGLQLATVRGVDPMPFKTWLLPHYRALPRAVAEAALAGATALSLPLDQLFGRWLTHRSWHKILVARHARP